jgi:hypothetical protein
MSAGPHRGRLGCRLGGRLILGRLSPQALAQSSPAGRAGPRRGMKRLSSMGHEARVEYDPDGLQAETADGLEPVFREAVEDSIATLAAIGCAGERP